VRRTTNLTTAAIMNMMIATIMIQNNICNPNARNPTPPMSSNIIAMINNATNSPIIFLIVFLQSSVSNITYETFNIHVVDVSIRYIFP
jgi:hypothetical protein